MVLFTFKYYYYYYYKEYMYTWFMSILKIKALSFLHYLYMLFTFCCFQNSFLNNHNHHPGIHHISTTKSNICLVKMSNRKFLFTYDITLMNICTTTIKFSCVYSCVIELILSSCYYYYYYYFINIIQKNLNNN